MHKYFPGVVYYSDLQHYINTSQEPIGYEIDKITWTPTKHRTLLYTVYTLPTQSLSIIILMGPGMYLSETSLPWTGIGTMFVINTRGELTPLGVCLTRHS